jgi:hypothetical protein
MSQHTPGTFTYDLHTIIQKAPPMSGVYAIFSRGECLYVGASVDICASLLEIYYENQPCLNDNHLTHFSFDLDPPEVRGARLTDRIRELRPVCNLRAGSPECRRCRLSQGKRQGADGGYRGLQPLIPVGLQA